ncbi:hypothetical protein GW17_00016328 [Ensete ventricosum]|nr:hypothetical protein GW17_00016328 [Ensete ventricosum]
MKIEAWLEDETASGAVGSAALLTGDSTHGRCRCRIKMVETGVACSGGETGCGQSPAPSRWRHRHSWLIGRLFCVENKNDGGTIENTCMRAES